MESRYAQTLHEFQAKEIARIGKLVATGLTSVDIMQTPGRLFAYKKPLRERLLEMLREIGNFGAVQVKQELKRQQ